MSKTFNFDPSDWNSINEAIRIVNEQGQMTLGHTSKGEFITFDVTPDGCLHTKVLQSNSWVRHNYYNPKDYTIEEMYEK